MDRPIGPYAQPEKYDDASTGRKKDLKIFFITMRLSSYDSFNLNRSIIPQPEQGA
jgi:hypothetical protein